MMNRAIWNLVTSDKRKNFITTPIKGKFKKNIYSGILSNQNDVRHRGRLKSYIAKIMSIRDIKGNEEHSLIS